MSDNKMLDQRDQGSPHPECLPDPSFKVQLRSNLNTASAYTRFGVPNRSWDQE